MEVVQHQHLRVWVGEVPGLLATLHQQPHKEEGIASPVQLKPLLKSDILHTVVPLRLRVAHHLVEPAKAMGARITNRALDISGSN